MKNIANPTIPTVFKKNPYAVQPKQNIMGLWEMD